jgi:small subunit ribosomal protein S6
MKRVYELMVVLRPDFGVDEKDVKAALMKLLSGRELKELTVLGKKQLAYPIKKQSEGVYAVAVIEGAPIKVGELEKQLKMGTDILRYLLTVKI